MALADLTDRQAVLDTLAEFDELGRAGFLDKYGYGSAKDYFLRYRGKYYDSKAICGAAIGHQHPDLGPLGSNEFSGGNNTVKKQLNDLGFAVSNAPPTSVDELWEAIEGIRSHQLDGKGVPHKQLLLLSACRAAVIEGRRSLALAALERELDELIVTFSNSPAGGARDPLWRLQFDGLWEVTRGGDHLTDTHASNEPPPVAELLADDTAGSLPGCVYDLLANEPSLLRGIFERVGDVFSNEQLPEVRDWFFAGMEGPSEESSDRTGAHTWDDSSGVRTWGATPRAWMVRGGANGEDESFFFEQGAATVAWDALPDPPEPVTDTWLRKVIANAYPDPDFTAAARANFLGQLWPFMTLVAEGDLIVTPLQTNSGKVAIGICSRAFHVNVDQDNPTKRFRIDVDWRILDVDKSILGTRIGSYLNQPRTVGWLDDDTTTRLQAVLATGSPRLYWWVNQRTSWEAEEQHGCLCAPQRSKSGSQIRHHLDVGRVQVGDVIVHYADGDIWAVSEATSSGHESIRPYELGTDRWRGEVFLARCWYDRLPVSVSLADVNGRNSDSGPFNKSGGVKQGYLWPLSRSFVNQLVSDHKEALRGTALNQEAVWLLQANPDLDKSQFPKELRQHSESNSRDIVEASFELQTHYRQMRAGDRALFWLSGEQSGIYATGWLASDPYQEEGTWHVNVAVWWNTFDDPLLKTDLMDNQVLKDLGPIRYPPATSYEVTLEQWAEFKRLASNRDAAPPLVNGTTSSESPAELSERLYLEPASELEEIIALLGDRPQAIFYGPPGTGKTWVALKLAEWLAGSQGQVKLVQFHPSYAYEDFVEGWRPTEDGNFELRDGPLKRLADQAADNPDHTFVLVVDEINRANLSKVLGELFFLLEYRDHQATLQYSDKEFSLPTNLTIIGTMNTADRSIALVDAALRRRFHFHPFFPDRPPVQGILKRWLDENRPDLTWVADLVDRANDLLDDRNMAIGPSHFMKEDLTEERVQQIWRRSIIPFVEDQFFDEPERVKQFTYESLTSSDTTEPETGKDGEDADPSSS
ncbi:MAG: EVE domain-containing protein [Gemmatimonadales bacterium]|jgi:hypothetical protein|nr:EVE domain-containing protein [Pseudomonadota bacterium]MBT7692292.1 EVE domain-containing protein [Gemmatimonadales bacterium]